MHTGEIVPSELLAWLQEKERSGILIDVRELHEWEYYHLDEALHIPMQTVPAKLGELPQDCPIYVVCAHGIRSANVCDYLQRNGFDNAVNVAGGMAAVSALRGFQYD